jgi:hypothetical protein
MSVSLPPLVGTVTFNTGPAKASLEELRKGTSDLSNALAKNGKASSGELVKAAGEVKDAITKTSRAAEAEAGKAKESVSALTREMRAFGAEMLKGVGIGAGFSIGAKAAEMLIGTVKGAAAAVAELVAQGNKVAVMSGNFEKLSASVGGGHEAMLKAARSGVSGLVADYDIMASANKALLLGLPVTAKEFGTLSKAATSLGRAMGQDATKSLDDLITGLGRGSALILDNLGIVVNAEAAHERYAASVGKSAESLSEAEKKVAVYNSAVAAMSVNVDQLGGLKLTLADRLQQVNVMWENLYGSVGAAIQQSPALSQALGGVVSSLEEAAGWIEENKKQLLAFVEDGLVLAIDTMRGGKEVVTGFFTAFSDVSGLSAARAALKDLTSDTIGLLDVAKELATTYAAGLTNGVSSGLAMAGRLARSDDFMGYKDRPTKAEADAHWSLFGYGTKDLGGGKGLDPFAPVTAARRAEIERMEKEQIALAKKARDAADRIAAEWQKTLDRNDQHNSKMRLWDAKQQEILESDPSGMAANAGRLAGASAWLAIANSRRTNMVDIEGPKVDYTPGITTKISPSSWYNHAGEPGYIEKNAVATDHWKGGLQGIALLAGVLPGKFGQSLDVIRNMGQSFHDAKTNGDKFYAIASGIGQIGGLIGGKGGSALQGAAGGAMSGFAIGGPVGAVIGGAAGGIMGLLGASGAQKKELLDTKKQLEGLSETAQKFGIDLTRAFSSKSIHEVKSAIDSVNQAVEAQKTRLAGLGAMAGGLNEFTKAARDDKGKLLLDKEGGIVNRGSINDQDSSDRAGRYAMFAFGNQVKDTGDVFGALESISPTLKELAASAAEFKYELAAGVQNLIQMNAMDEGLKSQVSGLNGLTKGVAASGLVTKELFGDLGADAVALKAKLEDSGMSGAQSMALMQPTLQQLYELQNKHGFAIDKGTQALLDQAKAEGIVGDAFMSANERIVTLLGILIETVGGKVPDALKNMGNAAETEFGRMADAASKVRIPVGGGFNPNPGDVEGPRQGSSVVSGSSVAGDRLVGMSVGGAPVSFAAGGGPRDVSTRVTFGDIHVHANDAHGGTEAADAILTRLSDALYSGGPGAMRFRSAYKGRRL